MDRRPPAVRFSPPSVKRRFQIVLGNIEVNKQFVSIYQHYRLNTYVVLLSIDVLQHINLVKHTFIFINHIVAKFTGTRGEM